MQYRKNKDARKIQALMKFFLLFMLQTLTLFVIMIINFRKAFEIVFKSFDIA